MPTLLSRSKHEEFDSNSTSYIRDQEERREENIRKKNEAGVFFAMIAKSTVHSENFNFRYACIFRYDSPNNCE